MRQFLCIKYRLHKREGWRHAKVRIVDQQENSMLSSFAFDNCVPPFHSIFFPLLSLRKRLCVCADVFICVYSCVRNSVADSFFFHRHKGHFFTDLKIDFLEMTRNSEKKPLKENEECQKRNTHVIFMTQSNSNFDGFCFRFHVCVVFVMCITRVCYMPGARTFLYVYVSIWMEASAGNGSKNWNCK